MEANRVTSGQSNLPGQIGGTQSKSGEESFHDMAKSDGYDKGALEEAVSERTRLTRTKRADRTKKKSTSLFVLSDDEDLQEDYFKFSKFGNDAVISCLDSPSVKILVRFASPVMFASIQTSSWL